MILATKLQFESFIESLVWKDMLNELAQLEQVCRTEYDGCTELRSLGHIQGRLEAINFLRELPNVILESISIAHTERSKLDHSESAEEFPEGMG